MNWMLISLSLACFVSLPLTGSLVHLERHSSMDTAELHPVSKRKLVLVLGLLERMDEPSYIPKTKVYYNVSDSHRDPQLKEYVEYKRFQQSVNFVRVFQPSDIIPPDVSSITKLVKKNGYYSDFRRSHKKAAHDLVDILTEYESFDDFITAANHIRNLVNPYLFVDAYYTALALRSDTRNVQLPPLHQIFPDLFVHSGYVDEARQLSKKHPHNQTVVFNRTFSGNFLDPEHKLWYFREDYGINNHHWNWHIVYRVDWGHRNVSYRKNRSGELFYHMHSQMLARYDTERLANGLRRVQPLHNFREQVLTGYYPHLTLQNGGIILGSRPKGLYLQDVKRIGEGQPVRIKINDLERWRGRIFDAINRGFIICSNGTQADLTDLSETPKGIDYLGRIVEASYSLNPGYYGTLHNDLHDMISLIHDPHGMYKANEGVMGKTSTAIRDPVFFQLHKFVDDIFREHKNTLPAYTWEELSFDKIEVKEVNVQTEGHSSENVLITGWGHKEVDLSRGLDLLTNLKIHARFTFLQHKEFNYSIQIINKHHGDITGTVRIFIAPQLDENNDEYSLDDQRILMIEMDRYKHTFQPGSNNLQRSSLNSTVTIQPSRTWEELEKEGPPGSKASYCGCGWPGSMLVPRGTHQGMRFSLVVMVSEDIPTPPPNHDSRGSVYCGIRDGDYPDSRPMGFPWDRRFNGAFESLASLPSNTKTTNITIKFTGDFLE